MIFYSFHVNVLSVFICVCLITGIYFHFIRKNSKLALGILLFTGCLLRLFMASLDPFLNEWDERFHALVAKSMMDNPFKPMMRVHSIFPFKIEDWCCNHIWVHKQPLFLWQMALSMKFFGTNEIALRIPSVIMGTISIFLIYDIARLWTKNLDVAFISASLFTVSYFQLELTSGRLSLDHNDLAFAFYVTASFWAFLRYVYSERKTRWLVLTGIFVGCAVLIKWLTGILVFGGWGLYILTSNEDRLKWRKWTDLIYSASVSILVFLPWQLYIKYRFPAESAIMYAHNRKHMTEALDGHSGTIWFHLSHLDTQYGGVFILFLLLGIIFTFLNKSISKRLSISFLSMIAVIYLFFSLLVKTKMPAFTFPVYSLIWILISIGIGSVFSKLYFKNKHLYLASTVFILSVIALKPWQISKVRSDENTARNDKIYNTNIYKSLDIEDKYKDRVVLNTKGFEDIELMFYQDITAYSLLPQESMLDSLINEGYKFSAFKDHKTQKLPLYISSHKEIIVRDEQLK